MRVRAHTKVAKLNQDSREQLKFPTLAHSAFSPALTPSGNLLFLQFKKNLKRNHYDSDGEEVRQLVLYLDSSLVVDVNWSDVGGFEEITTVAVEE